MKIKRFVQHRLWSPNDWSEVSLDDQTGECTWVATGVTCELRWSGFEESSDWSTRVETPRLSEEDHAALFNTEDYMKASYEDQPDEYIMGFPLSKEPGGLTYIEDYADEPFLLPPKVKYTGSIKSNQEDVVNSPSHYKDQGTIECIDYIKSFLTTEEYIGYLRGNLAKYLHRWRYKNGLEDLHKADWYKAKLNEEVENT